MDYISSISPYSLLKLQYPRNSFDLQNSTALENITLLRESVTDPMENYNVALRLTASGTALAETVGAGMKFSIQEQILTNYTNSAALVTKAVFLKGGITA